MYDNVSLFKRQANRTVKYKRYGFACPLSPKTSARRDQKHGAYERDGASDGPWNTV